MLELLLLTGIEIEDIVYFAGTNGQVFERPASNTPENVEKAREFLLNTKAGGLFQLISKKDGEDQTIEAKKVLDLEKPTAMTFAEDGSLYITVIGTSEGDKKGGKLLKVKPGL